MKNSDHLELSRIFTAYLKTIVKNARFDYINRMNRTRMREEPFEEHRHEMAHNPFDIDKLVLQTALRDQPLIRQQILHYSYHCEYSAAEIANLLQCSVGYVNRQKRAAIHALRKKMEGEMEDT